MDPEEPESADFFHRYLLDVVKTATQRLVFLRRLKRFGMDRCVILHVSLTVCAWNKRLACSVPAVNHLKLIWYMICQWWHFCPVTAHTFSVPLHGTLKAQVILCLLYMHGWCCREMHPHWGPAFQSWSNYQVQGNEDCHSQTCILGPIK